MQILRFTTTDSANTKVVLRAAFLCLAVLVAPMPMASGSNSSLARESDGPVEEQEQEKEQVISSAESSQLHRKRHACRPLGVSNESIGAKKARTVRLNSARGHRLSNGLCAPLLR